ncbi:MAG: metallophosphoesterase [Mongoliibacter sp.]|uniref:calcineurin-like phosphoesterase family protein n=1 Tax=Mongoliibacter sp. TaxID=2022438 RepID=UPI0012EF64E2|nr:calcineurin-like phosphoesterase family protein [Mongoliibacter sp.]TVP43516.1 MAG: metallophosphoesterase [Mongoliibacter sp.]
MKKISIAFYAFFLLNTLQAQTVTGFVFEDLNQNGKKERREPGIPGVAVSNGEMVVLTDDAGKYELPVSEDDVIFVIKPSEFDVPVDDNNLPQFFYIHKPQGSPVSYQFKGVSPTGSLPKSVDFGLFPGVKQSKFSALIFGDPQPYNMDQLDYFDKGVVSEVEGIEGIDFGISLGDIVGDDPDLFKPYAKVIGKIGVPWYSVMGNHDMNFDAQEDRLSDESFTANFGPATYAFNHGEAHFIVLENILYPDPRDGQGYWGGFRPDQLKFIENDLKTVSNDKLIVLFMHIPLFEEGDSFRDADREKLLELLSDFPNTVSLSAHTHYMKQTFFGKEDGYMQEKPHHHFNIGTPSGDWYSGEMDEELAVPTSTMRDGSPNGYVFMDFDGVSYVARYKPARRSADYQIEIFTPKAIKQGARTSAGFYANFFTGTKNDDVKFRINDGEWKKMNNIEDYDPSYLVEMFRWDTSETPLEGRRPSNPVRTDHLWRTAIPAGLPVGEHTLEVMAEDMYGNTHYASKKFRVVD